MMETRQDYRIPNGQLKPLDPRWRLLISVIRRCLGYLMDALKTIEEMS